MREGGMRQTTDLPGTGNKSERTHL